MGKVQGMPYSEIHEVRDNPRDKKFRKPQFVFTDSFRFSLRRLD